MKTLKLFYRLLYIHLILMRYGLDQWIVTLHLFRPLRYITMLNPAHRRLKTPEAQAIALRKAIEKLGPIFVKFGQALSTRPDILPKDVAIELAKLQDQVPPFPSEIVLQMIKEQFNQSAFELFKTFDPTPLASASIAQVHAATLPTGESVVVKLLRPHLEKHIAQDIQLLLTLATLAERYWPKSRRFKPRAIVLEFKETLFNELDLQREAANASQLKRNFQDDHGLYVPQIYWPYVRRNILVMERIEGIPISDLKALDAHRIDRQKLAQKGVDIFFTQVFQHCFFHADMHPGNIFVSPHHRAHPQYICVDFGIMGTLNDEDQHYLAENLLAFFHRDYRRVATLHVESGWVNPQTRIERFESAIRTVCEPIFEKPLKDISFAAVVLRLFEVARQFDMEVQPQLILLQKTLLAIEGLGRQLDPELDLWATAQPFLEQWVRQRTGPRALWRSLKHHIPFIIETLPTMPRLIHDMLLIQKKKNIPMAPIQPTPQHRRRFFLLGLLGGILSTALTIKWFMLSS